MFSHIQWKQTYLSKNISEINLTIIWPLQVRCFLILAFLKGLFRIVYSCTILFNRSLHKKLWNKNTKVGEVVTCCSLIGIESVLFFRRFQTPDLDVQLSDELASSLRSLKVCLTASVELLLSAVVLFLIMCFFVMQPEGSILKDRFKSLQKRNLIEPRERAR